MRRWVCLGLLALGIALLAGKLAGVGVSKAHATAASDESVLVAAFAPYRATEHHEAAALCDSFTPAIAAKLVLGAAPGQNCESAAAQLFSMTAPNEPAASEWPPLHPQARDVQVIGSHARLELTFAANLVGEHINGTQRTVTPLPHDKFTIAIQLEQVEGRWLIASSASLSTLPGCLLRRPAHCASGAKVASLSIGTPTGSPTIVSVPMPTAVRRAGAREKAEYQAGMGVLAQAGCLACHRLGHSGNHGPGESLTHIGAQLSTAQIEHAILRPHAPMPSFKGLPEPKLHDLVRFLSLLR